MKKFSMIALLVVSVMYVTLTACTLKASTPPAVAPTPTGEAPFPFQTSSVATFGTQTAIALTPVSTTPQVAIATSTPAPGQEAATQAPQAQPQSQQPTATAAGAVINTPVVNRPTTYVLQKGEFPYCIARRFDLDVPSFLSANGLSASSNSLSAGMTLKIPASGNWNTSSFGSRSLKAHPASYTVVAGDTLYSIACKYGDVTPEAILAVNSLSSASDIKAGMTLKIP